ncbi:54S ribosomal protein L17 mitochondrial [Saitozyma podzolica]|uniref:54S ribosomal protein L17 mitochondrial n=1 Tax=Saitozyma podzolica TaxID=1890683 RepID=A0A427YNG4_9TREE|nr:54S ribosomal protein L17 mitochondrial [Saitozyma podzolica]
MSFNPRVLARSAGSASRSARRHASSSSSSSSSSAGPQVTASLLLSRPPLLTPSAHPLESAYYAHSSSVRSALSNPAPTQFYFKPGSLPLRRFQRSQHQHELETFGPRLAGSAPDVGDVPGEAPVEEVARDHWVKEDSERGEKSLERWPEEEVYCLVKDGKRWSFPSTTVEKGEGLDEATFFLRSHILAGEPSIPQTAGWSGHAWLSAKEVEEKLRAQGDEKVWEAVKGMFGVAEGDVQA